LHTGNALTNLHDWPFATTIADSEKEFDRTITYMRQTIDALKDLDNANSRFVIAEVVKVQTTKSQIEVV
jgi:glyceraldehyde-3-phosphate dehydrogenase (NADP+)